MGTTQQTFAAFSTEQPDVERPDVLLAPDDPESCPWCYAPPEMFRDRPLGVGCARCHSLIPVDAEWYKRGEKMTDLRGAYKMASMMKLHEEKWERENK